MSVARVTEITARSAESFEDAVRSGIKRANETLRNVEGAWVSEEKVVVENGEVREFQVAMKVTFVLD